MHSQNPKGIPAQAEAARNSTPLMVASGSAWVEGVTFEWPEEADKEAIRWLIILRSWMQLASMTSGFMLPPANITTI